MEDLRVSGPLAALGAVELVAVEAGSLEAQTWRALIAREHYLGEQPLCGARLRYLVRCEPYGWLGALAFTSASWAMKARDQAIGWEDAARRYHLRQVVANARFLIRPGVQVPNLASHVLGLASRRLPADWETRYGVRPLLLETFVDPTRFSGHCYRAANWIDVGTTSGRRDGVAKQIFLLPLHSDWRELLSARPRDGLNTPPRAPASNWAEAEFATVRWYDERLKRRLVSLALNFCHRPQANVPEACASRAGTLAAYRFFRNRQVNLQAILTPHIEASTRLLPACVGPDAFPGAPVRQSSFAAVATPDQRRRPAIGQRIACDLTHRRQFDPPSAMQHQHHPPAHHVAQRTIRLHPIPRFTQLL